MLDVHGVYQQTSLGISGGNVHSKNWGELTHLLSGMNHQVDYLLMNMRHYHPFPLNISDISIFSSCVVAQNSILRMFLTFCFDSDLPTNSIPFHPQPYAPCMKCLPTFVRKKKGKITQLCQLCTMGCIWLADLP